MATLYSEKSTGGNIQQFVLIKEIKKKKNSSFNDTETYGDQKKEHFNR